MYPVNFPGRDYQFAITRTALFSNTLVALPTGLGKTLIAAVVMYNYFRWFPDGKCIWDSTNCDVWYARDELIRKASKALTTMDEKICSGAFCRRKSGSCSSLRHPTICKEERRGNIEIDFIWELEESPASPPNSLYLNSASCQERVFPNLGRMMMFLLLL